MGLERQLESEADAADAAVLNVGIREAGEFGSESGIVDERIDADSVGQAVVGMVERIQEVDVELKMKALGDVGVFEDSDVDDVGVVVAEDVAAGVAERSAEDSIRRRSVGDEMHLTGGDRRAGGVAIVFELEADASRGICGICCRQTRSGDWVAPKKGEDRAVAADSVREKI